MRHSPIALLLAMTLLAGCGGGGSSSSPVLGGGSQPSGSQLSTQDAAQSGTDAAFEPLDTSEADAGAQLLGAGTTSSAGRGTLSQVASLAHPCKNRTTRTVTANPDGSVTVETIHYYDDACSQVERDAVDTYKSSGGTATIVRTVTTFSQNHTQLGVRKINYALTGSTSNGSSIVTSAFYPGTSTTAMAQYGHSSSISGAAYNATTARIANNAKPSVNASYGHQSATTATISSDASGDVTFTGSRNGASFKAALNGLTLSSAPPFTITGGTQIGSSALTGSVTFDNDGELLAVNLTGTLAGGNHLVVTSSADSHGVVTVNGTITSSGGVTIATFTTDASGNGVLTLADGTQVPIVDWHVVW